MLLLLQITPPRSEVISNYQRTMNFTKLQRMAPGYEVRCFLYFLLERLKSEWSNMLAFRLVGVILFFSNSSLTIHQVKTMQGNRDRFLLWFCQIWLCFDSSQTRKTAPHHIPKQVKARQKYFAIRVAFSALSSVFGNQCGRTWSLVLGILRQDLSSW